MLLINQVFKILYIHQGTVEVSGLVTDTVYINKRTIEGTVSLLLRMCTVCSQGEGFGLGLGFIPPHKKRICAVCGQGEQILKRPLYTVDLDRPLTFENLRRLLRILDDF